jgi:hypothetical protein
MLRVPAAPTTLYSDAVSAATSLFMSLPMLQRRHFLFGAAACSVGLVAQSAEIRIRGLRTISALPQAASEIKELHERARSYSAELLPEGEPFEIKSFTPFLTKLDEIEAQKRLPNTSSRRHALSVGLEMMTDDQKQLPTLSRDQILSYLKSHFVSVQARIYREPLSRVLYLGPRCLALTSSFQSGAITKVFSPTVAQSLDNTRSLGLLLPKHLSPTPSNLRTLVLVHKNQLNQDNTRDAETKTNYEYLFIRARAAGPDQLELNVFATSDERTKLHWLKRAQSPTGPSDCSVRGAVHFTEYSQLGLYPKSAVTRRSLITGKASFTWAEIDMYSQTAFRLPAFECITEVLDAIIDGELKHTDASSFPLNIRPEVSHTGK